MSGVTLNTEAAGQPSPELAIRNIRGSTLLLSGRAIALGLSFLAHFVTIRYLSKLDYGIFAFAFAVADYGTVLIAFGMDRTIARFAPMYHERRDHSRLLGAVVLASGSILALSVTATALVYGFRDFLGPLINFDRLSLTVLLTLTLMSPLNAFDRLMEALFATFGRARTIFMRKHVLRPCLKLLAISTVVLASGDIYWLAIAHLAACLVGVSLHSGLVIRLLFRRQLFEGFTLEAIRIPFREILNFSLPQFGCELTLLLRGCMVLILLRYFGGVVSIADYWVVLPIARLDDTVIIAFSQLYTATASRLHTRGDRSGLDRFYWQSAAWITVLSFPIFAVSFVFARPVTVLLFGERYSESSPLLALIALGLYVHAAFGLNGRTLRVEGRVMTVLMVEVLTTIVSLLTYALLIPEFGAFGAALATCLTLATYTLGKQAALLAMSGAVTIRWEFAKVYGLAAAATLALIVLQWMWAPRMLLGLAFVILLWLALILLTRDVLDVEDTFPELLRLPFMRQLLIRVHAP